MRHPLWGEKILKQNFGAVAIHLPVHIQGSLIFLCWQRLHKLSYKYWNFTPDLSLKTTPLLPCSSNIISQVHYFFQSTNQTDPQNASKVHIIVESITHTENMLPGS